MKNFGGLRKGDNIKVSAKARGVAPGESAEIYKTRTGYVHSIYDQFIVLAFPYTDNYGNESEFKESFTTFQFRGISVARA